MVFFKSFYIIIFLLILLENNFNNKMSEREINCGYTYESDSDGSNDKSSDDEISDSDDKTVKDSINKTKIININESTSNSDSSIEERNKTIKNESLTKDLDVLLISAELGKMGISGNRNKNNKNNQCEMIKQNTIKKKNSKK